MSVNKFYYWFWILYLPSCVLFYHRVWDYIDESMTLALLLFTIIKIYGRKSDTIGKEITTYVVLMFFYVAYSVVLGINSFPAILYDFQQQVRPYIVFFCTLLLAPNFTKRQEKWMIRWFVLCCFGYFIFGGGRYGSFESPVIAQGALMTATLYILFKGDNRHHTWRALLILSLGLLSAKSKFFGEYVVFIALFFHLKSRLKPNLKTIVAVSAIVSAVVFFTWEKFNAYYVEGMQEDVSKNERRARPESFKVAGTIIFSDFIPFGSGLASFGTNAAGKYYSPLYYEYGLNDVWGLSPLNPMFVADAFYPTLAQYGIVGVFFFIWFWLRRYKETLNLSSFKLYKVAMMMIFAILLEAVADTSYLSGKGMGYFMLLAMTLRNYTTRTNVVLLPKDTEKEITKEEA